MKCPNCGAENPEHVAYCGRCSFALRAEDHRYDQASRRDSRLQDMTVKCPRCGEENRGRARFCDNCGTDMTGGPREDLQPGEPRLYPLMRLDWLLRFAIMAVGGSAFFILTLLWGDPGYAILFLCISIFGWACTLYMLSHR